jgi:hypothetical protein
MQEVGMSEIRCSTMGKGTSGESKWRRKLQCLFLKRIIWRRAGFSRYVDGFGVSTENEEHRSDIPPSPPRRGFPGRSSRLQEEGMSGSWW